MILNNLYLFTITINRFNEADREGEYIEIVWNHISPAFHLF